MTHPYRDFAEFLAPYFSYKVQKISIHAGFTCPNRDGTVGRGGCTYCNNQTFSPAYCHTPLGVTAQLTQGIDFFARKYPEMRYLAYFQAYTNTYDATSRLISLYEEALAHPGVVGLVIGTRPDCLADDLLDYFEQIARNRFLLVELGVESTSEETLLRINRGHTFECACEAIERLAARGIHVGAHMILGLPGESNEMILRHAERLAPLPLETLKLHQLQLIKGTPMGEAYAASPDSFRLFTPDCYIDLAIDFVERLPSRLTIERFISQSPPELIIAPEWRIKNHVFTDRLLRRMNQRGAYQGRLCLTS